MIRLLDYIIAKCESLKEYLIMKSLPKATYDLKARNKSLKNWVNQWSQLFSWNRETKFYKVNKGDGNTAQPIPEWDKYPNLSYIDYPRLAILAGL